MPRKNKMSHPPNIPPNIPSTGGRSPMITDPMIGTGSAKRQPVILKQKTMSKPANKCAEVAGGAAVNCAAVCCCCPCGIVSLLLLATVRVPAGICRRVLRAQRRRRKGKVRKRKDIVLLERKPTGVGGAAGEGTKCEGAAGSETDGEEGSDGEGSSPGDEMAEFEREMWAKFYNAGFWRSPSQRSGVLTVNGSAQRNSKTRNA